MSEVEVSKYISKLEETGEVSYTLKGGFLYHKTFSAVARGAQGVPSLPVKVKPPPPGKPIALLVDILPINVSPPPPKGTNSDGSAAPSLSPLPGTL